MLLFFKYRKPWRQCTFSERSKTIASFTLSYVAVVVVFWLFKLVYIWRRKLVVEQVREKKKRETLRMQTERTKKKKAEFLFSPKNTPLAIRKEKRFKM